MQGTRSAAVHQCPLAFCYLWTSAIGFWNYSVHWLWQGNGSCKYTLVHSARSFTTKVTRINNSNLQCSVDTITYFPTPAPLATRTPQDFSTEPTCEAQSGWQFNPLFSVRAGTMQNMIPYAWSLINCNEFLECLYSLLYLWRI